MNSLQTLRSLAMACFMAGSLAACNDKEPAVGHETANPSAPPATADQNRAGLPLPGRELNAGRDLLPFNEQTCVDIGAQLDPAGAAVVCQNLFSVPANRNGLVGDGFVASTHLPQGVLFEHGLLVRPDADGFVELNSRVWWDADGNGVYEPYTGALEIVFQNLGFADTAGFPFSDVHHFPGTPVAGTPGLYQARVDTHLLPGLIPSPEAPGITGYEIFVAGLDVGNSSRMLTLKNLLIDSGDQQAIALADEIEFWDLIGPFTPVIPLPN
ncbi:MAG: hypothetical protein V4688_00750 [Pseudomonadota bacterium]